MFNAVPPEEMGGIMLEGPCWEVAGRRVDQAGFFRALSRLVPERSFLFVEGGEHPPLLKQLLEDQSIVGQLKIARGTIWPRSPVFHLPATHILLKELADIAETCAAPELCDHLHVCDAAGVLIQWHDAFSDPFYISKRLPRDHVDAFCRALGTSWKDVELCSS
jgi:hypothetical protein